MNIDRRLNGADLTGSTLWVAKSSRMKRARIASATRIGVAYAGEWAARPWRFFDADSPYVSTVLPGARQRALKQR
jgi:DNA-3-methyladenine glycosylase